MSFPTTSRDDDIPWVSFAAAAKSAGQLKKAIWEKNSSHQGGQDGQIERTKIFKQVG